MCHIYCRSRAAVSRLTSDAGTHCASRGVPLPLGPLGSNLPTLRTQYGLLRESSSISAARIRLDEL
jgi:hypothetical protein